MNDWRFGRIWAPRAYGRNVGDVWLGEGSDVQAMLDKDGEGLQLVHEVIERDGRPEEAVYVTKDPDLIARARAGTVLYWEQKRSES